MSRESLVFLLGIVIFFMPHFGLPAEWKDYFYMVAGLIIMICGYSLRRKAYLKSLETMNEGERSTDSFVEQNVTE